MNHVWLHVWGDTRTSFFVGFPLSSCQVISYREFVFDLDCRFQWSASRMYDMSFLAKCAPYRSPFRVISYKLFITILDVRYVKATAEIASGAVG